MTLSAGRTRTALIIDDDETFRDSLTAELRNAGYRTVEAGDGASAVLELEKMAESIDLIVVDLCLPRDVNGLDIILAATRRKIPATIVAASAVFDQSYLDMAQEMGAHVAIRKPAEGEIAAWWRQALDRLNLDPAPPAAPSQRVVVLAEDEEPVRRYVKALLQRGGFQVLEAADGVDALALIEKIGGALDLLVTDYEMPNLNGAGLVRAVRDKYPRVPVVCMSGYVSDSEGQRLDDPAAASAFVAKPFIPKVFLSVVKKMVETAG